jgi:metal-sulfur cluster biosynthetic enzyme
MTDQPLSVTRLLEPGSEADQLRELLRDVPDPELGVDIVSLGLVYGVEVHERTAAILATTTTAACPLGDYITSEIERVLLDSGFVDRVEVELTYNPPWTPQMMDDVTKRAFGWA